MVSVWATVKRCRRARPRAYSDFRTLVPQNPLSTAARLMARLKRVCLALRRSSLAMNGSPLTRRTEALTALSRAPLDLLIIGGGIVGAGIARDAAMRGLRAGLVEQNDFASGTSSRSSRLLHGGLRYLAQGRVGLVRESSLEKTIIRHIAPHLAQPLAFVFPTYRGNRKWVLWQLKLGVKIYDLLCGGRNLGKSTALTPTDVLRAVPALNPEGLTGAVRYYDGFTNDARLV